MHLGRCTVVHKIWFGQCYINSILYFCLMQNVYKKGCAVANVIVDKLSHADHSRQYEIPQLFHSLT